MSKEVKRYDPFGYDGLSALMYEDVLGDYVRHEDYEALLEENEQLRATQYGSGRMQALRDERDALLAERDALRNENGSMRNAMKNARYRIEQGRVWNGMGWTLTGLHAYQQQVALDEIDAALQGEQP